MTNATEPREGERLLCTRNKRVDVYLLPGGRQYRVVAEMQDGVHHMRIMMLVNEPSLRIKEVTCEMPGVPDPVCLKALDCLESLVGRRVVHGLTRGLSQLGEEGCTHLVNLFHEACYNVTLAQAVNGRESLSAAFPGIDEAQTYKIFLWFKPDLINSCVRYAENGDFIRRTREAKVPAGAEKLKAVARRNYAEYKDVKN